MDALETEVKFYLRKRDPTRRAILDLGAEVRQARVFETNIRYENREKSLIKQKMLLRLRKDAKATLTVKSAPDAKESQFKVLRELEVEVSDFSTMHRMLTCLGFHREQVYEKWRETFTLGKTLFCLDTMPFGDFLEIEGDGDNIVKYSRALDFKWEERILKNYLELFEEIRRRLKLPFSDVTFENFKKVAVPTDDFFPDF